MNHQMIRIEDDLGRLMRSIDFVTWRRPLRSQRHQRRRRASRPVGHDAATADSISICASTGMSASARRRRHRASASVTCSTKRRRTTVKASAGRFVGRAPLGAAAFAQFPSRLDRSFDPATGALIGAVTNVFVSRASNCQARSATRSNWSTRFGPGSRRRRPSASATAPRLPTVMVNPTGTGRC